MGAFSLSFRERVLSQRSSTRSSLRSTGFSSGSARRCPAPTPASYSPSSSFSITAPAAPDGHLGAVPRDREEPTGARILQLNLNKNKKATSALNDWSFDLALVQEPNLSSNSRMSLVGGAKKSFCLSKARAAVVVNTTTTNFWPVPSLSTRDLAVVAVDFVGSATTMIVASGYLDIQLPALSPELVSLINFCALKSLPLLVGLDTNAHSILWGSDESNLRGERLEDWIMSNNLSIQNVGTVPTFAPIYDCKRRTIIDVTITNDKAERFITDWKVEINEPSFSDHRIIMFSLANCQHAAAVKARRYKKADWKKFQGYLEKTDIQWPESEDVEEAVANLHLNLQEALDLVAPLKVKGDHKPASWWTSSLLGMRATLKNLYHKRDSDRKINERYRALKKTLAREIKIARKKYWQDFCSRAESAHDISKLVQVLENPPERRMSLLTKDGDILPPEDSLHHLLSTHFPDCAVGGALEEDPRNEGVAADFTGVCQFITPNKIYRAFNSFGDYKSPGPDELPPIALKNLPEKYLMYISLIYQLSIAIGKVPRLWREMRVVFIPKAGKSDYALAKAYRPITLSNFLLKGLERLIQWFIIDNVIPAPLYRQHAYTKGRSCDTALSTFVNDVENSVLNGQHLLAVSLDCSGAFDCIKFDSAQICMERKGIPQNIVIWYNNLLQHRQVHAEIQGRHTTVAPARGSPQGGVLSPLVWNLIMDSFLSQYRRGPVKVLGYADDILLYIAGFDAGSMGELLQEAVNNVVNWGRKNGLSFNPKKTKMVLFTKKKKKIATPHILIGEEMLESSDSFKYLGVEMHRSLTWTRHITERTNRCKFLLLKCKGLIGQKWGLSPDKVEWIHKSIIRPKISYGSIVWAHKIARRDVHRLGKLQRLGLLLLTQPLRSTPTAGLEVLLGWLPLDLHAQETGVCTYLRIQGSTQNKHLIQGGHLWHWNKMTDSIIDSGYPREGNLSQHIWIETVAANKRFFQEPICIYSDASKEGDNVGYAFAACDGDFALDEKVFSAKEVDVFLAEVMAIKEALSWIKNHNDNTRSYVIWSDSLSAVKKINGHEANGRVVLETMQLMETLGKSVSVQLTWTKGHADNTGNEYADALARTGAEAAGDISYATPFFPLSWKETKRLIRPRLLELWQEAWDRLGNCKVSRLFYPSIREGCIASRFTRTELQNLSNIVTGHGSGKNIFATGMISLTTAVVCVGRTGNTLGTYGLTVLA